MNAIDFLERNSLFLTKTIKGEVMKMLLRGFGYLIGFASAISLFLLDMWSLILLASEYGLLWAFVAFFVIPAQVFVPFLVGTWIPAIALTITTFLGFGLVVVAED